MNHNTITGLHSANGARSKAIQDTDGRHVLAVPWLSQHTDTAQHAPGDCGPACITMVIHHLTDLQPTVDQVSVAGGVPKGADWASLRQLQRSSHHFGIGALLIQPVTATRIDQEINAAMPLIVRDNYATLNKDRPEKAHFLLVVGFSPSSIIYHDSNKPDGSFIETERSTFLNAMRRTSRTPGNTTDNHAITFYV